MERLKWLENFRDVLRYCSDLTSPGWFWRKYIQAKEKQKFLENYRDVVSQWPPSSPGTNFPFPAPRLSPHCTALNSKAHWNCTLHCNVDARLHTIDCTFHTAHCNLMSTLLNAPPMAHHSIDATILHNIGTLQGVHYKQCHTSIYANALHNEVALTQLVFCHSYTVFCANKDHIETMYMASIRT